MLFELINPSDPYTFKAPSVEVAGVVAVTLSSSFGARCIDSGCGDISTPVLFGWKDWLLEYAIDADWMNAHAGEIADSFDSFIIGGANERGDVESMLAMLPEEKREEWRAARQDRHRTSLNQIGEAAYQYAKKFRKIADRQKTPAAS